MENIQRNILAKIVHSQTEYKKSISNNINTVVCAYMEIQSNFKTARTAIYREFIDIDLVKWQSIYLEEILEHKLDGHLFNVFSLWNKLTRISEPIHSQLLSFLLSRDSLHGQGNTFLHLLLKQLNIVDPEQGIWNVFTEYGGADILIKRTSPISVVIIENKSNWAADQPNQLYRYWYRHIYQQTRQKSNYYYEKHSTELMIIYLSPNENKRLDNQTLLRPPIEWFGYLSFEEYASLPDIVPVKIKTFSFYSDIARWLTECIETLPISNYPLREYIRQYQNYCKTL